MRQWMNLFENKVHRVELGEYVLPFRVWENPSADQAKHIGSEIRGIVSPEGDIFVWDAYDGIHQDVANSLAVDYVLQFTLRGSTFEGDPEVDQNPHFVSAFPEMASLLSEGDVIDLKQRKTQKAFDAYADALGGIIQGEKNFFTNGKFGPFAKSYIESGFDPKFKPDITIDVSFRDLKLSPGAREVLKSLRSQGYKVTRFKPQKDWDRDEKGNITGLSDRPVTDAQNTQQDCWGGFARKENVDVNTAKAIFTQRESSPLGAYRPSRSGFRTASQDKWDERGVGFHITVTGMDGRRGDKYGNPTREETHIIDNDADMKEVADMFAAIERARWSTAK